MERGRTVFSSMDARRPVTEGLSREEHKTLRQSIPVRKGKMKTPFVPAVFEERRHPVERPMEALSLKEKAAWLAAAERAARKEGPLRQVSLTWGESVKSIAVLNNQGRAVKEHRSYVTFVVQATAEKNGLLQTGYEVCAGMGGVEVLGRPGVEALARLAARRALVKLNAPSAPLGEMSVVISSQAGGTLIHEAIGHALEADSVQDGSSPHFAGKIGKRVANEKISVLDDPTRPGQRGSFFFDDEGTATERTVLVENGVLKTYLYDHRSAARDRRLSNGHGRRESYRHKPIPRMSNTFVAPGTDDPKQILRELRRGLFVTRMGGGQVNTTTGDFVFEVEEGFWVENGRLKHPVRGANLLGNGADVLRGIDRVGWDLGWSVGTCGKEGQGAPVSDGVPTLRLPNIVIGGTQQ
jgi:TldD protein